MPGDPANLQMLRLIRRRRRARATEHPMPAASGPARVPLPLRMSGAPLLNGHL